MSEREVMTLVCLAVGLLFLVYTVWARRGRSRRARHWMRPPLAGNLTERFVILGMPTCGLALLALSANILPPAAFGIDLVGNADALQAMRAVATGMLVLLAVPLLYWLLTFIPLPDFLYPPWAREVRRRRRAIEDMFRP